MSSPLAQAASAGSYSVRGPHRSSAAMAGLIVLAIAGAAFAAGFNVERNRPMPVAGTPLAAVAAVPLQHDQLAQLLYPQAAPNLEATPAAPPAATAPAAGSRLLAAYRPPARSEAFSAALPQVRADAAQTGLVAVAIPVADIRPAMARDVVGELLDSAPY